MKVTCNRAALYEAVQIASSIVPSRTPKPVLQCAKLEADQQENKLTVLATDNEIAIKYLVPQVQVVQSGVSVVPADRSLAIPMEATPTFRWQQASPWVVPEVVEAPQEAFPFLHLRPSP